jgi:hypothetical protein
MVSAKATAPDLTLVIDFGGSLTKVIYQDDEAQPQVLAMEPEVISLNKEVIEGYEARKMGSPDAVNSAWVGCDSSYYAVGYLARSQFYGNAGLSSHKYERAFAKTLAAVWVVAQLQGLTKKKKIKAAIAVLLPAGEFENASQLREDITDGLKEFSTPTGTMRVALTHYECKPEGGGVYMVYAKNQGSLALKTKTIAVVMVGYRNASILVASRGVVGKRETSELGFIRLVELVKGSISTVVTTARIASVIALSGESIKTAPLMSLAMSSREEVRREEVHKLASAIEVAREQYLLTLGSWFRETLPKELDEIILCGGTAYYLKESLEKHFSGKKIIWDGDMELPSTLQEEELGRRMCDAYGMYQYFKSRITRY